MSKYRYDKRSEEEFKRDIKKCSADEAEIAVRICIDRFSKSGTWPSLVATGTDGTGEFVADNKKVDHTADYYIEPDMVEITKANPVCARNFHQKIGKVKRAIAEGYHFVFVNGFAKDNPQYVILTPLELAFFTDMAVDKYGEAKQLTAHGFTNKAAYRYDINWFKGIWRPLPEIDIPIPLAYKMLMAESGVKEERYASGSVSTPDRNVRRAS